MGIEDDYSDLFTTYPRPWSRATDVVEGVELHRGIQDSNGQRIEPETQELLIDLADAVCTAVNAAT